MWDSIDTLSDCFNMTLTDILDKHAPLKTRIMITRPKIPWFNDDIKQLKRKRRRLEKKALKTDLPGDWNNYHKVRNQYSALLKSAHVNYYSNLIDQCAGDSRKLFRVVNSLSREPLETALSDHDDPTKLAHEFGTFLLKKIEIIKENPHKIKFKSLDLAPPPTPCYSKGESGEFFFAIHCRSVSDYSRILQCLLSVGSCFDMASGVLWKVIMA